MLKSLSLRDRSWTRPPVLNAIARVPVQFEFFCGVGRYVASEMRFALDRTRTTVDAT